jgi:hypothetical protein
MITNDFQTLGPAYGRDYKSAAEVIDAFNDGKDFIMLSTGHNGTYCSKRDFAKGITVQLRYDKLRKETSTTVDYMSDNTIEAQIKYINQIQQSLYGVIDELKKLIHKRELEVGPYVSVCMEQSAVYARLAHEHLCDSAKEQTTNQQPT